MQNIATKIAVILVLLGLCVWAIIPPKDRIRLGKDLRGGVSLIYHVNIEEGSDNQAVLGQVISVLKERVNPTGVLDISMQPLGADRIEIVMPLPNATVKQLRDDFESALDDLLRRAEIPVGELDSAVRLGTVVEQFGGEEGTDRFRKLQDLQDAYADVQTAQQAYEEARTAGAEGEAIGVAAQAVADATILYDDTRAEVLRMSLDRASVVRALQLPTELRREKDAEGNFIIDEDTGRPAEYPSQREDAIGQLQSQFSHLTTELDDLVVHYDTFQQERSGFDDPEDLKRLLRGAGVLEFRIAVVDGQEEGVNLADMRQQLQEVGPENTDSTVARWVEINDLKQWYRDQQERRELEAEPATFFTKYRGLVGAERDGKYYLLIYTLPAKSLTHAGDTPPWRIQRTFPTVDQLGRAAVGFNLDQVGGGLMSQLTGAHVSQPMAILLDGQVFSAPTLQTQIGVSGIITGDFTQPQISYLIRVLAAGALEARLSEEPIAVNTLGPSLGADNLRRGRDAFVIAIIAVAVFMLFYYFFAGLVADFALLCNGILIFGVMAAMQGTFTLPGLAGIVLTIGMAVDANVLIYERIREEIFGDEDVDLRTAVRLGYAKALSTIIDANITNLIVCGVLYKTATTEVKGFATTLTIGICATLFTSLFVTRQIYYLYTDFFKIRKLPMLATTFPAIHRALEPNINWIGLRGVFWVMSAIAIMCSVTLVWSRGVNLFDTDLRGGLSATMVTAGEDRNGDGELTIDERLMLPHTGAGSVEERIHALGENTDVAVIGQVPDVTAAFNAAQGAYDDAEAAEESVERLQQLRAARDEALARYDAVVEQAILRELMNADVLTAGTTVADADGVKGSSFQVKVPSPKGVEDDRKLTSVIVEAIVDEFGNQLDVTQPLAFRGFDSSAHAEFTHFIEHQELGANIDMPQYRERVTDFVGGVAVVVEDLMPAAQVDDLEKRIERMRQQPDFSDCAGRSVRVVGLQPADPNQPELGFRSVVVLVYEKDLSLMRVDQETWDQRLAKREWELIQTGLQRQTSLEQVSSFSSAVAATLQANATVAVVLSLLGILLYIWIRFGSLRYSIAAIVALMHDVMISLGLLAMSGMVAGTVFGKTLMIEDFRINLGVVAALLTIIGYSLNDTIVILDRIRENRGKRPAATAAIINRSINQTVSRTLLTSVTTLLAVGIMYFEGGSGIRSFTFCLLAGLVVGTYSSVAIAAPLVLVRGGDSTVPEATSLPEPSPA